MCQPQRVISLSTLLLLTAAKFRSLPKHKCLPLFRMTKIRQKKMGSFCKNNQKTLKGANSGLYQSTNAYPYFAWQKSGEKNWLFFAKIAKKKKKTHRCRLLANSILFIKVQFLLFSHFQSFINTKYAKLQLALLFKIMRTIYFFFQKIIL